MVEPNIDRLVEDLFRHQAGMMTAVLARIFGPKNLELVEEVVQDALVRALEIWPYSGVPKSPNVWLVSAAKNRAINILRRRSLWAEKIEKELTFWLETCASAESVISHTPAPSSSAPIFAERRSASAGCWPRRRKPRSRRRTPCWP